MTTLLSADDISLARENEDSYETDHWYSVYRDFVLNEKYLFTSDFMGWMEIDMTLISFSLFDFDSDGIPELFIFNGSVVSAGALTLVYTCENNEITNVGTIGQYYALTHSPDSEFSGIFEAYVRMGSYEAFYLELRDGEIAFIENVHLSQYDHTNELEEMWRTENSSLYNAYIDAIPLQFFSLNDVRTMTWDEFVNTCLGFRYNKPIIEMQNNEHIEQDYDSDSIEEFEVYGPVHDDYHIDDESELEQVHTDDVEEKQVINIFRFWSLGVILLLIVIWGILADQNYLLRGWVIPTFCLIAITVNLLSYIT
jgi:hypothetical protein